MYIRHIESAFFITFIIHTRITLKFHQGDCIKNKNHTSLIRAAGQQSRWTSPAVQTVADNDAICTTLSHFCSLWLMEMKYLYHRRN